MCVHFIDVVAYCFVLAVALNGIKKSLASPDKSKRRTTDKPKGKRATKPQQSKRLQSAANKGWGQPQIKSQLHRNNQTGKVGGGGGGGGEAKRLDWGESTLTYLSET